MPPRFFYAIAAQSENSKWFDELIKVDASGEEAAVVASWSSMGVFLTEADFVPGWVAGSNGGSGSGGGQAATVDEDLGTLLTVAYNSTSDSSFLAAFDAKTLELVAAWDLGGGVVPFHAHGIVCPSGDANAGFDKAKGCYTNP